MCSPSPAVLKRKRLHYTADDDLYLLREVAGQNPYMEFNRWNDIQKNVRELTGKEFGVRSLKERVQLLVDKFRQKVEQDQYKSGIEEEVSEIDDLLYQILLLIDEVSKAKKTKSSYQRGHEKRELAVYNITENENQTEPSSSSKPNLLEVNENEEYIQIFMEDEEDMQAANDEEYFQRPNEPETPHASIGNGRGKGRRVANQGRLGASTLSRLKRTGIKQTSMKFLEVKNERWFEIRRRELDLEERKFEFDKEERRRILSINEARLELEQKRFEAELNIFSIQNKLMNNQQQLMELAFHSRHGN